MGQLSPCVATTEAVLCNKRNYSMKKPAHHNREQPLLATTRETPSSQKLKKKKEQSELRRGITQVLSLKKALMRLITAPDIPVKRPFTQCLSSSSQEQRHQQLQLLTFYRFLPCASTMLGITSCHLKIFITPPRGRCF